SAGEARMKYVRCVKNETFIYDQDGKPFDDVLDDLQVGQVYRLAPPVENDGAMLRVVDESGEDYLYPTDYFERFEQGDNGDHPNAITIYVSDFMKGILHAEAVAARKSFSALLREWVDERLDLPAGAAN
ncbi:MAG: hypothetical protein WAV60_23300, partial [Anaerolineae bacterium]